jgi:hypothetical protein
LADDGYGLIQKQANDVRGILPPYHAYIDTCASYSSTPYKELLLNLKKQARGLIGHSNAGLCGMDLSGSLRDLEQVWFNKGRVVTIILLKQLEKHCPVRYDSFRNQLKNNGKGMPYIDLREFKAKAPLKTNKLIYWIKILLRYSYWISDALFFFDTLCFVRNILMLLLIRVFISRSLMLLVKC